MAAVRPTFLVAVPRIFNRVYDTIVTKVNEAGGAKKKLFDAGVAAFGSWPSAAAGLADETKTASAKAKQATVREMTVLMPSGYHKALNR